MFSMLPVQAALKGDRLRMEAFSKRHLQMFGTNPYLVPAVVGSVASIEECVEGNQKAADLKAAVMGPYAAIGDSFFGMALRLFSSTLAALVAYSSGNILAPAAFMLVFTPAQLWVRIIGFIKGYSLGMDSFQYIRALNLTALSSRLHYVSLFIVVLLTLFLLDVGGHYQELSAMHRLFAALVFLLSFLCALRGVSAEKIIYGVGLLCMVLSF